MSKKKHIFVWADSSCRSLYVLVCDHIEILITSDLWNQHRNSAAVQGKTACMTLLVDKSATRLTSHTIKWSSMLQQWWVTCWICEVLSPSKKIKTNERLPEEALLWSDHPKSYKTFVLWFRPVRQQLNSCCVLPSTTISGQMNGFQ